MPEIGFTTLVSEISCVVEHAKLPNLIGHCSRCRLHLRLEQMKAFRPMEGRRCDGTQFEWIYLVNYYNLKPSFTQKKSYKILFCKHRMATMVEVFECAVVSKTLFC